MCVFIAVFTRRRRFFVFKSFRSVARRCFWVLIFLWFVCLSCFFDWNWLWFCCLFCLFCFWLFMFWIWTSFCSRSFFLRFDIFDRARMVWGWGLRCFFVCWLCVDILDGWDWCSCLWIVLCLLCWCWVCMMRWWWRMWVWWCRCVWWVLCLVRVGCGCGCGWWCVLEEVRCVVLFLSVWWGVVCGWSRGDGDARRRARRSDALMCVVMYMYKMLMVDVFVNCWWCLCLFCVLLCWWCVWVCWWCTLRDDARRSFRFRSTRLDICLCLFFLVWVLCFWELCVCFWMGWVWCMFLLCFCCDILKSSARDGRDNSERIRGARFLWILCVEIWWLKF